MNKPNLPFKLPKEPVDKYELVWFNFWAIYPCVKIKSMSAIYYINSSYKEVTGEDGGAHLVNEWMLSEDGCRVSRWMGWDFSGITGFATIEEAIKGATQYLEEAIQKEEKHIAIIKNKIAAAKEEIKKLQKDNSGKT